MIEIRVGKLCSAREIRTVESSVVEVMRVYCTLHQNNVGMRPHKITKYGKQCFEYATPSLWNELPASVRASESMAIFKNRLKTHLFRKCYNLE